MKSLQIMDSLWTDYGFIVDSSRRGSRLVPRWYGYLSYPVSYKPDEKKGIGFD